MAQGTSHGSERRKSNSIRMLLVLSWSFSFQKSSVQSFACVIKLSFRMNLKQSVEYVILVITIYLCLERWSVALHFSVYSSDNASNMCTTEQQLFVDLWLITSYKQTLNLLSVNGSIVNEIVSNFISFHFSMNWNDLL